MKIKFWGAARTVTGSMHLLELHDGTRILLDCGLYQGEDGFHEEANKTFPCDPASIQILILSHAHIDHCGNIPLLVKSGFKGEIYCTHATYDLATLLMLDSAKIQEQDVEHENKWRRKKGKHLIEPIYTSKDVDEALELFHTIPYRKKVNLTREVELTFIDAGHMLGSASVNLVIREGDRFIRLGFTGDVGRPDRPILKNPEPMLPCDHLISESTYGGKDHENVADSEGLLEAIIREACVERKGKLIIPAFSVGRTQDLVYALDRLENAKKLPRIQVFVDSPMSVDATRVFEMHPECFNPEMTAYMRRDPEPFGFSRLNYVRTVEQSKALNDRRDPCIIISASGMVTAGRILHHIANNISNPANTVLIVGYCAKGTLGSQLVNGAESIHVFGKEYHVRAQVKKLNSFSGHAGQTELYEFIRKSQDPAKLKSVHLVHGEEERAEAFRTFLMSKGFTQVTVATRGEEFTI